jgi:hypothetical protein
VVSLLWGRRLVPGGPVCLRWFDSSRPCLATFLLSSPFLRPHVLHLYFLFSSLSVRFTAVPFPIILYSKYFLNLRCQ